MGRVVGISRGSQGNSTDSGGKPSVAVSADVDGKLQEDEDEGTDGARTPKEPTSELSAEDKTAVNSQIGEMQKSCVSPFL